MEVKRSQEKVAQGISQHLRNQKPDLGAPNLFFTAQLLIAANSHEPRYATVGTPAKFWSAWREREDAPDYVAEVVNRAIDTTDQDAIFQDFGLHRRKHDGLREAGDRFVTPLDEMLVSLCRPERILDLARRFTLFDGGVKKVARHQQYFAVKDLLKRVEARDDGGRRAGGVVWHTQGSGKSLTMVKAYLERIRTQRDKLDARDDEDDPTPHQLRGKGNETAFWGIARKELRRAGIDDPRLSVRISLSLTEIIENRRRVGWQHDRDIQNDMRNAIDDFFFDDLMGPGGVDLNAAVMDSIVNEVLSAARVRMQDDGRVR